MPIALTPGRGFAALALAVQARRRFRGESVTAAVTVAGATALVYLATAAKEILVAFRLGATDAVDAFLVGNALLIFLVNVLGNSFAPAVTPAYVRAQARGQGRNLYASSTVLNLMVLSASSLVAVVAAGFYLPFLTGQFDAAKLTLARQATIVLAPAVLLRGAAKAWGTFLNTEGCYFTAAIAPVTGPLLVICFVGAGGSSAEALAYGTLAGAAAESVWVGWRLRSHGYSLVPQWAGWSPDLRAAAAQYLPALASAAMMAGSLVLNQALAAHLARGSVAALNYGMYAVALVAQTGSIAVYTAALPAYSRLAAAGQWQLVQTKFQRWMAGIAILSLPPVVVFLVWPRELVHFLMVRGAFRSEDALQVADVVSSFAPQIPFFVLNALAVRVLSSLAANRVLVAGAAVFLVVNAALNLLLIGTFGLVGIGWSTSLTYLICFLFHYQRLRALLTVRQQA